MGGLAHLLGQAHLYPQVGKKAELRVRQKLGWGRRLDGGKV